MQILAALDGVKKRGKDKWFALCPCHKEKTPSLSINLLNDGKIMIYCFGCGANGVEVYRELGLNLDELFGGKKLESTHVPQEIRDSYKLEHWVVAIHAGDLDAKRTITLKDRRRNRLAVARITGIEEKWPQIKELIQ